MASHEDPPGRWTTSVRLVPAGPELELAVARDDDGGADFDGPAFDGPPAWLPGSRAVFARRTADDAGNLLVVVLQAEPDAADNAEAERAWLQRLAQHRMAAAAFGPSLAATTAEAPVPPTTWCAAKNVFFQPFCPTTLTPLRTCRDDAALARWGLEPFSTSRQRYATGALADGINPDAVYTQSLDSGKGAVDGLAVRRRGELFRDYASLWQRDLSPAQQADLHRNFPCWLCSDRGQCYAAAPEGSAIVAEQRLVTLDFHAAQAIVLEATDVSFDVLAALLGGAPAAPLLARELSSPPAADRRTQLIAALDGERAWLTPGARSQSPEVTAQLAREIAATKLRCFEQLCRHLLHVAERTGAVFAPLAADRVRAHFVIGLGAAVPSRWTAAVRLLPGGRVRANDPGSSAALGSLLAQLLLVRDDRTESDVQQLLRDLVGEFERGAGKAPGTFELWARNLAARQHDLDATSVLYVQAQRQQLEASPLPREVWLDACLLMLRLASRVDGFSFAPQLDVERLRNVVAEAAALAQRLEIEAFGAEARRAELSTIVTSLLESMPPDAPK